MSDDKPRRGGRPSLIPGHRSQQVNVRIPDPLFDELDAIARQRDVPLRQVVREAIAAGLSAVATSVSSF
jgi:predicted transcriptional regulator